MKKKIYVVGYPGESGRNMMLDIQKREDTTLIDDLWGGKNVWGKFIEHIVKEKKE